MFFLDPWAANGVCLEQHNQESSGDEGQSAWMDSQMDRPKVPGDMQRLTTAAENP